MKRCLIIAMLTSGLLLLSASARDNSGTQATSNSIAPSSRKQSSTTTLLAQSQVPPGPLDATGEPQQSSENHESTILVDVWSSAPDKAETANLSPAFERSALTSASKMRSTERTLEDCIKKHYPLGEAWIHSELDSIGESLRLAAVSAKNDADRQALQQLENEHGRLKLWMDWLVNEYRNLRLANYYMSESALDNDEQFQSNKNCTSFLVSMLSSGRVTENYYACP